MTVWVEKGADYIHCRSGFVIPDELEKERNN
jgi:hypothetical protein